ncbi:uncharacterized protein DNG_02264 [Cephalotrichum gorgonifer]|uniref:Uncharacterized protein n=1 Tax=Cephalotrichum gorgonifer TaxID=2041049 RepID=A0AAE8SSE2_9PEZI|nr:uncharacterized protein DNG_02264 [Cephalotrichum gorgonifer]
MAKSGTLTLSRSKDSTNPTIQSYIDRLTDDHDHAYFKSLDIGSDIRRTQVQDNVFLILGLWMLMREYFVPSHGKCHILWAYKIASTTSPSSSSSISSSSSSHIQPPPLEAPLSQLIETSSLLPSRSEASTHDEPLFPPPQVAGAANDTDIPLSAISFGLHLSAGLTESLSIEARDLNLFRLTTLADVSILWTDNISRHLLLTRRGQRRHVELFALPCAMGTGAHDVLRDIGIPADVMHEIKLSYANLFNPAPPSALHRYLNGAVGLALWCWCLSCSSRRLRDRAFRDRRDAALLPYDPLLRELAEHETSLWEQSEFENLWPRIVALERCLQEARPWNFWVLLRDSRDTVQYWTFL